MGTKVISTFLALLMVLLMLSGCGKKEPDAPITDDTAPTTTVTVANPEGALSEIYLDCTVEEIITADDIYMQDTLGFDLANIDEYHVRASSGRYGLADVYIIKPYEEDYDLVRENLEAIKLDKIRKTESYDVLGSNKIAQNATIFRYGAYLIMLMLEDNAKAETIIEQYIPSN